MALKQNSGFLRNPKKLFSVMDIKDNKKHHLKRPEIRPLCALEKFI
jgi:hypothetical protein